MNQIFIYTNNAMYLNKNRQGQIGIDLYYSRSQVDWVL